jgi:hypothetical protein
VLDIFPDGLTKMSGIVITVLSALFKKGLHHWISPGYDISGKNFSFSAWQIGHRQPAGRFENSVTGLIFS